MRSKSRLHAKEGLILFSPGWNIVSGSYFVMKRAPEYENESNTVPLMMNLVGDLMLLEKVYSTHIWQNKL